jgi:hypothetical protein
MPAPRSTNAISGSGANGVSPFKASSHADLPAVGDRLTLNQPFFSTLVVASSARATSSRCSSLWRIRERTSCAVVISCQGWRIAGNVAGKSLSTKNESRLMAMSMPRMSQTPGSITLAIDPGGASDPVVAVAQQFECRIVVEYPDPGCGAWDNAKKYIEESHQCRQRFGCAQAAVTGDTVGDPQ